MEPSAAPQAYFDAPISKLNYDLLWKIFLTNTTPDFWYPPYETHLSPLSTTRLSSQVCHVWRSVILASPSIWGACLDLDALGQKHANWRHEVLKRTGDALLTVRARVPLVQRKVGLTAFFVDLIHEHWPRIRELDIDIGAAAILNDVKIWTAFARPARYLRVFALHNDYSLTDDDDEDEANIPYLPAKFRLFSDDAPLIMLFSLPTYALPFSLRPFPSFLQTGQLRQLSLHRPVELAAADLLVACTKMPLLERLSLKVRRLVLDDCFTLLLGLQVSLPCLIMVDITATGLDVYSAFLARIIPHPGCILHVRTILRPSDSRMTPGVQDMQRVIAQYANSLFEHPAAGASNVRDLGLAVFPKELSLKAHQCRLDYRLWSASEDEEIPFNIYSSIINAISSLKFSNAIVRLNLSLSPVYRRRISAPLLRMFSAIGSVEELVASSNDLLFLSELSTSEAVVLFPSLKILSVVAFDKVQYIKSFLAGRRHVAPIDVLNLRKCHWPIGDLRFLEDLTGLRVVWERDGVLMEYVCGSGLPKMLWLETNRQ